MINGKMMVTTAEEKETEAVGEILGSLIKEPQVITLDGDLGAGKTVLVRGAARGLESEGRVRSPTFNLLQVYRGKLPVYHFDFYRMEEEEELLELGLEEYLEGDGVVFIEWGHRFPAFLPEERLEICLERSNPQYEKLEAGEVEEIEKEYRMIHFTPRGFCHNRLIEVFWEAMHYDRFGKICGKINRPEKQGGS